jgi:hypothetical protein
MTDLAHLGQTIETETASRLLPEAIEKLRQGETLYFGRLSINREGIIKGNTTSPWSEIVGWRFDGSGWLAIERNGKEWKEWIVVSQVKVFNVRLLVRLLEEVKSGALAPAACD